MNIQSIRGKTAEIEQLLAETRQTYDVLVFTEHWLNQGEFDSVHIEGYQNASCFARGSRAHGGVCIFVHNDYAFTEADKYSDGVAELDFECCAVKIENIGVIVLAVYTSPAGNFDNFISGLEMVLDKLAAKTKYKICICGDFNTDIIKNNPRTKRFLDLINSYHYRCLNSLPTRGAACLDNVVAGNSVVLSQNTVFTCSFSDHNVLSVRIILNNDKNLETSKNYKTRIYSHENVVNCLSEITNDDWHEVFSSECVNQSLTQFVNKLDYYHNKYFPIKSFNKSSVKYPWITRGIQVSCRRKKEIYFEYKNGLACREYFMNYCRILKKVIRGAKIMYNDGLIGRAKNKNKASWRIIKNISNKTHRKKGININKINLRGENDRDTLNKINEHLIEKFGNRNGSNIQFQNTSKTVASSLFLHPTDANEVLAVLSNLKCSRSVGTDGISIEFLKRMKHCITHPIVHLINMSFRDGCFPSHLKKTKIILIHKKGSKSDIDNYRPIAILNTLSKIFEKVIADRLIRFFNKWEIFSNIQNGFIRGRNTDRAIFQLLERVYANINGKSQTAGLFIDLSKAFDTVSHEILLQKLERLGVRGTAGELLGSYLSERPQQVFIDDKSGSAATSNWCTVKCGVPQGSILGPLLFVVYMNDLRDNVDEHIVSYADDTSVVVSGRSADDLKLKSTSALVKLKGWFDTNELTLNSDKTQLMRFRSSYGQSAGLNIRVGSGVISEVDCLRFLGVVLDERLTWTEHIDYVASKICTLAYQLKTLRYHVSEGICLTAYKAYVQSVVKYGIIFWGNSVEAPRILTLQKRCLRNVFGLKRLDSCRSIFRSKKILTVVSIYILECAVFIRRNYSLFQGQQNDHNYNTRNAHLLIPDQTHLTQIQRSVKNSIIRIYNKLPASLKDLPHHRFRCGLKSLLVQKAYYTLQEFYADASDSCV